MPAAPPRPDPIARLARASAERERLGLARRLHQIERKTGARIVLDGRELIDFSSNDYLGLAAHPALREALCRSAEDGVGSRAAHLVSGHQAAHAALEQDLAEWTGRERALLFSSGMMANQGALAALVGAGDAIVADKLVHASVIDGARLSGAALERYPHLDVEAAERRLARLSPDRAALLVTDGVFSMDGDIAPLAELAALARRRGASLMVDDAHGLGVLAADGAGSVAAARLDQAAVPVLVGTLGKALGCAGAFVAGSDALIDGLIQFARSYIYTTAMPPALAAAARAALDLARREGWRREVLAARVAQFRQGAAARGLPLSDSSTPIQPLLVGSSARALALAAALRDAGFLIVAIRPPTVRAGSARLRITLSTQHTEIEVEHLLAALEQAMRGSCAQA